MPNHRYIIRCNENNEIVYTLQKDIKDLREFFEKYDILENFCNKNPIISTDKFVDDMKKFNQKNNKIENYNKNLDENKKKIKSILVLSGNYYLDKLSPKIILETYDFNSQDDQHIKEYFDVFFSGGEKSTLPIDLHDGKWECAVCKERKVISGFSLENGTRRKTCNSCRWAHQTEKAIEKEKNLTTKKCNYCEKTQDISSFEPGRNKCIPCGYKDDLERNSKKEKPTTGNPCTKCHKEFHVDLFSYHPSSGKYRNICNDCYTEKRYHKVTRERKREEDEETYLIDCAESSLAFREKDLETAKQKQKEYRKQLYVKINEIRNSCKDRGLIFHEEDIEKLREKLKKPCWICGKEVEEDGDGIMSWSLDRIDNSKGYCDANTLPSCARCNIMRGGLFFEQFQNIMNKIFLHHNGKMNVSFNKEELDKIPKTKEAREFNSKKSKLEHFLEIQKKRVVIYDEQTGKIGKIYETIKDISDAVDIYHLSGWYKMRNPDNIWVYPNWKARFFKETDSIDEDLSKQYETDLISYNSDYRKTKPAFYVKKESEMIYFKSITKMSKHLNIPARILNKKFRDQNYKTKDFVEIVHDEYTLVYILEKS